ncbi:MAG: nitroreductase family deazaflavin-dependent oxidoreductase [Acidimicrobiia bacterium]
MNGKDVVIRAVTGLHEVVFRASNGKLLNRGSGMPVLMLTTTGRKSGEPRRTMLTSPIQDGDRIVLVGSNNGGDRHPAWVLNLRADPSVEVMMNGRTTSMTAHVADADEKAELWPRIVVDHDNYAAYQRKTEREIPVVVLEPQR